VTTLIRQRVEPTVALATLTMIVAITIAVPLGVLAAWKRGSWIDRTVMVFAVSGFSMPVFWLGFLLVWVFALQLGWLPVQGYSPLSRGLWPFLRQLILPALTLASSNGADHAHDPREHADRAPRGLHPHRYAKGPASGRRAVPHALKNAGLPVLTIIGVGVAILIRRRGGDGDGVRAAGDRPAHGGRHPAPRLPGDPGRHLIVSGVYVLVNLPSTCSTSCSIRGSGTDVDRGRRPRAGRARPARRAHAGARARDAQSHARRRLRRAAASSAQRRRRPLWTATDAQQMNPSVRLRPPDAEHPFGTDHFGRDVFARTLYGGRISLRVGLIVALLALTAGTAVGPGQRLLSGRSTRSSCASSTGSWRSRPSCSPWP